MPKQPRHVCWVGGTHDVLVGHTFATAGQVFVAVHTSVAALPGTAPVAVVHRVSVMPDSLPPATAVPTHSTHPIATPVPARRHVVVPVQHPAPPGHVGAVGRRPVAVQVPLACLPGLAPIPAATAPRHTVAPGTHWARHAASLLPPLVHAPTVQAASSRAVFF